MINGFLAPPLLIVVMLIANNRQVMGKRVNGPILNVLGWATTAIMFAGSVIVSVDVDSIKRTKCEVIFSV